uniref:DMT family transporter n=1 Tax=Staphylothermus marinus TaxID=2280 RepID=A0A7C4HE75_STAMA
MAMLDSGLLAITGASFVWSLNPTIISRFAKKEDPFMLATLRIVFGIASLTPLIFLKGLKASLNSFYTTLLMIVSAILGPGLGDLLYVWSIQLIGGSLAVVIGYTYIFVSQSIAIIMLGEEFSFTLLIGSALAFAGVIYAVKPRLERGLNVSGVVFGFLSAIAWGSATVLIKILQQYFDPLSLTYLRLLAIAPLFPVLTLVRGVNFKHINRGLLIAASYTGAVGWGVGMVLYVYSIFRIGVAISVLVTALVPVLAQINVKLFAKEKVGTNNVIGALMVASAIALQAFKW